MTETAIELDNLEYLHAIFGDFDSNITILQKEYGVSIFSRDGKIKISGQEDRAQCAKRAIQSLIELLDKGETITDQSVRYVISLVNEGTENQVAAIGGDTVCVTFTGKPVKAKTVGQKKYIESIKQIHYQCHKTYSHFTNKLRYDYTQEKIGICFKDSEIHHEEGHRDDEINIVNEELRVF